MHQNGVREDAAWLPKMLVGCRGDALFPVRASVVHHRVLVYVDNAQAREASQNSMRQKLKEQGLAPMKP